MPDDYESNDTEEKNKLEEKEDKTEEEEEGELPPLSLQDIELLMENTEVWDELISGKISVDEAKQLFSENYSRLSVTTKRKSNSKKKKPIKSKSKKKKDKDENEEEE